MTIHEINYQTIFKRLNKERVDYVVAGGVAINFHGIPRMTYDLDLMILLQPENIKKMVTILLDWKYRPRAPVNPFDLIDEKKRVAWIKEPEYENMRDICKIIAKDIIDGGKNSLTQLPSGV